MMSISSENIISFGQIWAKFTQLAEKVHAGEKNYYPQSKKLYCHGGSGKVGLLP